MNESDDGTRDSFRAMVNGKSYDIANITKLRELIRLARREQFGEIGLFMGELPIHAFYVLFNGRNAWPCYSFEIDTACYSANNLDAAPGDEVVFQWHNGQSDPVSRTKVVPAAKAAKALEYFFKTRELDPAINWLRDV